MSESDRDPRDPEREPESEAPPESEDGGAMASLLKRSMADLPVPEGDRRVLVGFQKKLRQRSKGKFYGDGWSTSDAKTTYVLVAAVMLLVLGVAYFALGPVGISPR